MFVLQIAVVNIKQVGTFKYLGKCFKSGGNMKTANALN